MLMRTSHASEDTAFDLFREQAYQMIRRIPLGQVLTYGDVAGQIPLPNGIDSIAYRRIRARWVGYALKNCPQDVPWWRVVNRKGQVSQRLGHQFQRILLEEEGVVFDELGTLSLGEYRWTSPSD